MPKNGHISTRHLPNFQCGDRSPVCYGNVMEKLKITRQQAEEAVAEFSAHFPSMNGMTIPEEQFEIVKKPRGRPKKEKTDPLPESDPEKVKKPRGRPKKEKTVVHASEESTSIIDQMVAEAEAESEPKFPPPAACVSAKPKLSDEEKKARREAKKAEKKEKEEQNRKLAAEAKAKEEAEIAEQLHEIGIDGNPDDSNPEEELSDLEMDFGDESETETTNADDLD